MVPRVDRSLDTIIADNKRFVAGGGNAKRVKEFNNALFFDIPLVQVHARFLQSYDCIFIKM